jgi:HK97 family phage portal protein
MRAMYSYQITSGVGVPVPDKAESYINDGYAGNADVFSIISKINNMSKQGTIKLVQKNADGSKADVTGHPLNDFLYMVNPSMSFNMFWTATHIYKLAVGNSYWYKPLIGVGKDAMKTNEIHLMPAQFTEVITGDWLEPVKAYQLNFTPAIELEKEKVFHQKFFDPRFDQTFFIYGLSPIKAAAQVVSKLNQSEITQQKAFENSSPPYILFKKGSTEGYYEGLTKEQQNDFKKQLADYSKDAQKGKPMVTRFEPDIIKLGVSPVDLGMIESSADGLRKLCNIYQFPSVLMNDNAASTYNNISTARKAAWTDCLIPLNKEFAHDLTYFLTAGITEYEPFYFEYDTSEVDELQEGLKTKVDWMRLAGWSKNEIREATGQSRVENPVMDEPIFNQGEIPLSDMTLLPEESKDFVDYLPKNV